MAFAVFRASGFVQNVRTVSCSITTLRTETKAKNPSNSDQECQDAKSNIDAATINVKTRTSLLRKSDTETLVNSSQDHDENDNQNILDRNDEKDPEELPYTLPDIMSIPRQKPSLSRIALLRWKNLGSRMISTTCLSYMMPSSKKNCVAAASTSLGGRTDEDLSLKHAKTNATQDSGTRADDRSRSTPFYDEDFDYCEEDEVHCPTEFIEKPTEEALETKQLHVSFDNLHFALNISCARPLLLVFFRSNEDAALIKILKELQSSRFDIALGLVDTLLPSSATLVDIFSVEKLPCITIFKQRRQCGTLNLTDSAKWIDADFVTKLEALLEENSSS